MMRGRSDNTGPNISTTMWLGDAPLVSPATIEPAQCRKARRTAALAPHHQHVAGIRRLDQLANIVIPNALIGVSDQPPQPQSP